MKVPFLHRIPCHCVVPWWLGFVRHRYEYGDTVLAPVPLNIVYRLAFISWLWLRHPIKRCKADEYHRGFMRGRAYERQRQADRRHRLFIINTLRQKP
jgi:hypothetical protein